MKILSRKVRWVASRLKKKCSVSSVHLPFCCISPYQVEIAGKKGGAGSFLLFKLQQAGYCWEPLLLSCTCLFLYLLSGEIADQCRCCEKTTTYTHAFMSFCTFMFRVQSWAHQGTFLWICILPRPYPWFLFWTVLETGACMFLSVDQMKSFQWSPPGSSLCVRSADSGGAREPSGDAPVTPWSLLSCLTSNDVHI